ncbi:PIN domain-containing protein [Candidatus Woesearchaeota archaeon]|nr:PIN domain-containing protein [Candidatus Woesearchaeota archaeon]
MEVKPVYFFDSYALVEGLKGSINYAKYNESITVISILNLIEIVNVALRDFGESRARDAYNQFKDCIVEIDEEIILGAMKLKQKYNQRNLSYADCIGYIIAKRKNILFLTGDSGFKDLENVEFVK